MPKTKTSAALKTKAKSTTKAKMKAKGSTAKAAIAAKATKAAKTKRAKASEGSLKRGRIATKPRRAQHRRGTVSLSSAQMAHAGSRPNIKAVETEGETGTHGDEFTQLFAFHTPQTTHARNAWKEVSTEAAILARTISALIPPGLQAMNANVQQNIAQAMHNLQECVFWSRQALTA